MAQQKTNRREFLATAGAMAAGAAFVGGRSMADQPAAKGKGAPHADKLGWRLGCQAYTFHDTHFYEAMDRTASLGLHYIEAYPGQKLHADTDVKFTHELPAAARSEVKKRLADKGLKLVNFGVGGFSKEHFEFAKDMGIETLVAEPPLDAFDKIDKLCEEYQINLALHDHPKPLSRYWNPETVLQVSKGRSKRIGACCDTGHWMRSGIKPVEAVKLLEGRIISFHVKDLNEFDEMKAHDVPWGTGRGDIRAVLTEVHRQGIKPVFSVEYEYHYGHSLPEIAECVAFFDKVSEELAKS